MITKIYRINVFSINLIQLITWFKKFYAFSTLCAVIWPTSFLAIIFILPIWRIEDTNIKPNRPFISLFYLWSCNICLVHQASAQLLSAGMIIQAHMVRASLETSVLMRPWFFILVLAGAVEKLSGVALGVAVERDWVVLVLFLHCMHFTSFFLVFYIAVTICLSFLSKSVYATLNHYDHQLLFEAAKLNC